MRRGGSVLLGAVLSLPAFVACGSDSGTAGFGTGGCLSDQQICQFKDGVSTQAEVKTALGNAQMYVGSSAWMYVCQQVSGQQIIHNDLVVFDFDSSGRVSDVTVLRQGTGATPPPDCAAIGAGGQAANGACAGEPLPAPDSVACTGLSLGGAAPITTNCKDANGDTWSASCSGASCNCSYDGQSTCSCTKPASGAACCPGVP